MIASYATTTTTKNYFTESRNTSMEYKIYRNIASQNNRERRNKEEI